MMEVVTRNGELTYSYF